MGRLINFIFLNLVLAIIFLEYSNAKEDDIIVSTKLGTLKGFTRKSRDGKNYFAFTRVPYAKPPVGELRFASPEPVNKWTGILDATIETPICTQFPIYISSLRNITVGIEDCLYLNIFTNNIEGKEKFPVMIYIHGGGWRMGTPGPADRSEYLMDEDIVFVSINYRLGVLGFLTTEDDVIPGNFGMKDQALAIKWVSENIDKFGGDPKSITLFGESAGGASVHFHSISPLSKHLIKGVIAESGVATSIWAVGVPGLQRERAKIVAKTLNCPTECSKKMLDCFRRKTNIELADGDRQFIVWDFDPAITWPPVVESKSNKAFLTRDPYDVELTMPMIVGITSSEGIFKTQSVLDSGPEQVKYFSDNLDYLLPITALYAYTSNSSDFITEKVKEKYFSGNKPMDGLRDVFTDLYMLLSIETTAKLYKGNNLYVYLFDYRGTLSWTDLLAKNLGDLGVCHADELIYLFGVKDYLGVKLDINSTPKDTEISRAIIKLWTNFAKYGNPTPAGSDIEWRKRQPNNREYLHIAADGITMKDNLWPDKLKLWQELPLREKYVTVQKERDEL